MVGARARGTFEIDNWDETPYDEREGTRLTRTRVVKIQRGDVEGTRKAELLMAYAADEGAAYAGFERVTGRVHGRSGSFVLRHAADASGTSWSVVPETGMGELSGPNGEAKISVRPGDGHSLSITSWRPNSG